MVASIPGQTYSSAMGGYILPGSVAVTEDLTTTGGSVGGCGEASLLSVVAPQVANTQTSPTALGSLIQWADNHGLTLAANGDSTPGNLIAIAKNYFGVTINSATTTSLPALDRLLQTNQVEVGISQAYKLGPSDAGVNGHYITVVGKTADGNYVVSDPNTPQSESGRFVVYSGAQIMNASPFWLGYASHAPSGSLIGQLGSTSGQSSSSGHCFNLPLGQSICIPDTIWNWITQPIRLAKLMSGIILLGAGLLIFVMPVAAPIAAGGITALAGAPEAAPAVAGAVASVTHRRRPGEQRQAPPPASQTIPNAAVTVQRSYTTRRLQARTQPGTGYAVQGPPPAPAAAKPTAPIAQTSPVVAPKLGGTPNPMSPEEIAKAQGKASPGIAAFSQRFPAPQRSGGTGLTDTYTLGARRAMTRTPMPDAEVLQTKEDIRKFFDFQQGQIANQEDIAKRRKMTPEETYRELGISGSARQDKVAGTDITLQSEQATLKSLQGLLRNEQDPKIRRGLERDIKAVQERIKKMQGG